MKNIRSEEHESLNLELDQTKNKKKAISFIKGFLMAFGLMIILTITSYSIISYVYLCPTYLNPYFKDKILFHLTCEDYRILIKALFIVIPLVIVLIVIDGFTRNKNPYTWMGKIVAIFGLSFLIIKRNEEEPLDPYNNNSKKKKKHILFGFLLSIGLLIIYFPLIFLSGTLMEIYDLWSWVVVFIILLNIYLGVLIFFFKEKLRYISIGMISLPLIWISFFIFIIIDFL